MKKSELKRMINEEINRVLHENDEYGDLSNFDARVNKSDLRKAIEELKNFLSPEGWKILVKFIKGSKGWNRSQYIF